MILTRWNVVFMPKALLAAVGLLLPVLGLAGWWYFSRAAALPATSPAERSAYRLPADFEPRQLLVVACHELNVLHPELLGDLAEAVSDKLQIIALVIDDDELQIAKQRLEARGLATRVRFLTIPHDSLWIRDYGPIQVDRVSRGPAADDEAPAGLLLDANYYFDHRQCDDAAASDLARQFDAPSRPLPLYLSAGNLLSNGQGLAIATYNLVGQNLRAGLDEVGVRELLRERLGVEQLVLLEPLAGEITGHVDLFATFTSPQTVVVGRYAAEADPTNAAILDRNAARLAEVQLGAGKLRVERIPMPPHDRLNWPTYANVVYANGVLLFPSYPLFDPQGRQEAMEVYQRLLPQWKIVEIDAAPLVREQGALRCATLTLGPLEGQPPQTPQPE